MNVARRIVAVLAVIVLFAMLDALKAVRPALVLDGFPSVGAKLREVPADDADDEGVNGVGHDPGLHKDRRHRRIRRDRLQQRCTSTGDTSTLADMAAKKTKKSAARKKKIRKDAGAGAVTETDPKKKTVIVKPKK